MSHRIFCNCKDLDKAPITNTKEKSQHKNLRCLFCDQISLIELDKENLNCSLKCLNCDTNNKEKENNTTNYIKIKNQVNNAEYSKKSDFYCSKHSCYNYQYFCKECNTNICDTCKNRQHLDHDTIDIKSIIPESNEVFISKIKMRKIKEKNEKIIENIINTKNIIENEINSLIAKIKNITMIEEFIIKNYNVNNINTNYCYLKNFISIINNLDNNMPKLNEFINEANFESQIKALIDIIIHLRKNNHNYNTNDISNINTKSFFVHNNKIKMQTMKSRVNKNKNNYEHNDQYSIEKMNLSLDDTFQKNDKLEGIKSIANSQVKYVNILDNGINKVNINRDNNDNDDINNDSNSISNNMNNIIYNNSNNNINNNNESLNENNDFSNNKSKSNEEEIEIFEEDRKSKVNQQKIPKMPEIKHKIELENIIKSIEFIDKRKVLICDSKFLNIYEINDSFNLNLVYSKKANQNNDINYATKLKNEHIIICSTYDISIIKLEQTNSQYIKASLIQKIIPKSKSYYINKVIEIPNKSSIISCDKFYLTKFKKNTNKLYSQVNSVKIDSEIKCIEYINDDVFAAIMPEMNVIAFYDVDSIHNNYYMIEKVFTIHGRYVIANVDKLNCIFFASTIGIYIFSNITYKLLSIYKLDEWISAISYDFFNDFLICGRINKTEVNNKKVDLIIFSVEKNDSEKEPRNKIKLIEKEKRDNICNEEITAIKCSDNNILVGSKDKSLQLLKFYKKLSFS